MKDDGKAIPQSGGEKCRKTAYQAEYLARLVVRIEQEGNMTEVLLIHDVPSTVYLNPLKATSRSRRRVRLCSPASGDLFSI